MNHRDPNKNQHWSNLLRQRVGHVLVILTLLLLPLITVGSPTAYGAGGDLLWQVGDSRVNMQTAIAGTVDQNGNIIITGYEQAGSEDFYTSKLKADGTGVLWSASRDLAGGTDQGTDVAVDGNGDVIVCGYGFNGNNFDFHTIKYNGATGAILWESSFNALANSSDLPTALAIDSLNNIYVGGYTQGASGDDDFLIIKYSTDGPNADGTPQWQVQLSGAAGDQDRLTDLVAGVDGIAAVGHSRNSSLDFDYLTAKYAFDSTLIWQKTYDSATGDDLGKQVAMDGAGNVVVTGSSWNGTTSDIKTIRYLGADGAVDWTSAYDGGYADEPMDMTVDAAGDVYLTGATFTATGFNDIYTAKYYGDGASKGQTAWQTLYNSSNGNTDIGTVIVVDESGAVYVAGYSHKDATGDDDFTTIKYKKDDGTLLWQAGFNGAAGKDEKAVAIGLGNMAVYVGGWSDQWTSGNNDNDYYAVKYDAGLLDPPTGLAATTVSENEISLSWQDNSANEDGFKIERKIGVLGLWSEIAVTGIDVSVYNDSGLTADTRYYYRVRAYNATSASYYSNEDTALTSIVNYISPSWTFFYNGPDSGNDHATAIDSGPDQHPVVTGYSQADLGGFDYLTVKIDRASATELWSHRYDDIDSELDVATDIVVDKLNEVIVSGYSSLYGGGTSNTNDIFTMKYLADGPPQFGSPYLWTDQYNGPAGDDDRSASIDTAADTSNNVVVVGYGRNAAFNEDLYVIKYDSNGTRLWDFDYDGGDDDIPTAVSFDSSDDIIVAGSIYQAATSWDLFIRKYRGSDGFVEWTVIYDHAGEWDELNGLVVDPAGDVYITAVVTSAGGDDDFYTVKYNGQTGVKEWEQIYDGPGNGNDEAVAIQRDHNNGDIIVAGTEYSALGNYDFHIERYSSTGALVWQKTLDRSGSDDLATAMGIDVSGNICVTGNTDTGTTTDVLAIKYGYDGERIGATLFNGAGNGDDTSVAVTVNSLNEVYVAGETTGADGSKDYLVMLCEGEVLQAPSPFVGTPSYTSIDLNWTDNSSNENGFYLQRKVGDCASANTWQLIDTADPDVTNYLDSGLNIGSTYCYQVQSFRSNGESSRWIESQVTTLVPSSPGGFVAAPAHTTQMDLSWQDNTTGEDGFKIERCQGAGCSDFVGIADLGPDLVTYADTSVCEGLTYSYRILAYKTGQWTTQYSSAAGTTPAKATPGSLVAARISEGQVDLAWSDTNIDHSRFRIYRCEGSGCIGFAEIGTVEDSGGIATTYTDTAVLPDITYNYQVTAQKDATCNGGWESLPSNASEIQTTLIAPSGLTATTVNTTQIDLAWTDNTGFETGSVIERCTGLGCDFSTVDTFAVGQDSVNFIDDTVCSNADYSYRILAEKTTAPAWQTEYSTIASAGTGAVPSAPTLLTAARASEEQISLSWTSNTTDETGFELDRCQGVGCDFSTVTTLLIPAGAASFIDKGLTPDTTYRYRLRAYKSSSCPWLTSYSNASEALTTLLLPDNLTATAINTTRIDLAWQNHTSHETGIVVERCETGNCTFAALATLYAGSNSFIDSSVCSATDYSYRVKAVEEGLSRGNGGCWTRKADLSFSNFQENSTIRVDIAYAPDMQPDFKDIRFYDETATEELGHWIENKRDGVSATVWIATSSDPTIAMYYGNALADDMSNPALFSIEFHDDFQGTVIDPAKWVEIDSVNAIYQNNDLILNDVNYSWTEALISNQTFDRAAGKAMYMRVTPKDSPGPDDFMAGWEIDQTTNPSYNQLTHGMSWYNSAYFRVYEKGTHRGYSNYTTFAINNEYEMKVSLKSSGAAYSARQGSGSAWQVVHDLAYFTDTPMRIAFTQLSQQANIHSVIVAPESVLPVAAGTLGVEQQSACYTFTTWQSNYSNVASAVTPIVATPDLLTATAISESEINLDWTDTTSDESGFTIERCTGAGCDFSVLDSFAVGPDTTTFSDSGLTMSTEYSYRVQASKNASCPWISSLSNTASTTTLAPPSPTNLGAAPVSTTQLDLSWTDNTGSNIGFVLERCDGIDCTNFSILQTIASDSTAYSDATVCPDTAYNYQVKAYGDTWETGYAASTPVNVTANALAMPTLFTATGASETEILLSWTDNIDEEDGYRIERCTGSGCSDFTLITDITDSVGTVGTTVSYTDTNLSVTTTYNYRVYPYKYVSCTWLNYAVSGEATTDIPAPTGLAAPQVDTTQAQLTWTDTTTSETGFEVERCEGVGCDFSSKVIFSVGPDLSTFTDSTALHTTNYSYRVRAVNGTLFWSSPYSNVISITTLTPAPPSLLTATRSSEVRINLGWQDSNVDETNFRIERGDAACASFVEVATVAADVTSYSDGGLNFGSTYCYQVRAYKTATNEWYTVYSNTDTATTSILAPGSVVATAVDTTRIDVSWADNSESETGFEIDRCEGSSCDFSSKITFTVGPDVTSYADLSVCANSTYRYQVRAVKSGEWQSLYSNESEAITGGPVAPHSFLISEVYDEQSAARQLDLSWQDDNLDETDFRIERCEGSGCSSFVEIGLYDSPVGAGEFGQFPDVDLSASTTYCYRLWASKSATCSWDPVTFGLYTNVICDMTRPEAPTGLNTTVITSRVIALDWIDNSVDEDGFEIEKLLRNGKFVSIYTVPADTTTYTNTFGIDPETSYTYRVRATRGSDISAYSNEASATTPAFQASDMSLCTQ